MSRRHSWEKLEAHRYRCKREDCRAVAEKTPDEHGPGWFTTWTLADGRQLSTRHGDRTPPCEPVHLEVEERKPWQRPEVCGHGTGAGRICGAREGTRLYTCGRRCDAHAPWALAGRGDPDLQGPYCTVRKYRVPTPDAATWSVVDARAIASGKRRASPAQYAAARAVEAQKADRRDSHRSGNT